jgi:hypothetical protein
LNSSTCLQNLTKISPIGSKVISGGHIDRQAGDLISPLSLFESTLNTESLITKLLINYVFKIDNKSRKYSGICSYALSNASRQVTSFS